MQYIGTVLDSVQAKPFLPRDRTATIVAMVDQLGHRPLTDTLTIQRLLRHMAVSITVVPYARLRMRPLQSWFLLNFNPMKDAQDTSLLIPKRPLCSLLWCTNRPEERISVPGSSTICDSNDRFFPQGLGSSYRHGLHWRSMASAPHRETYQSLGASDDPVSSAILLSPSARLNCLNTFRQYNGSGISQQPGRHSVMVALPAGHRLLELLYSKFYSPDSRTSARSAQHYGRCPQQRSFTIP